MSPRPKHRQAPHHTLAGGNQVLHNVLNLSTPPTSNALLVLALPRNCNALCGSMQTDLCNLLLRWMTSNVMSTIPHEALASQPDNKRIYSAKL